MFKVVFCQIFEKFGTPKVARTHPQMAENKLLFMANLSSWHFSYLVLLVPKKRNLVPDIIASSQRSTETDVVVVGPRGRKVVLVHVRRPMF